jgi:hypothetical protein
MELSVIDIVCPRSLDSIIYAVFFSSVKSLVSDFSQKVLSHRVN